MYSKLTSCRVPLIVVALATLSGCPNAQTYGTPRTTPKGEFSHSVAVEGIGVAYKDANPSNGTVTAFAPNLPSYQFRVGVADNMDLGVRLTNLTNLQLDYKFNFLKSDSFDMAVNPGLQVYYFSLSSSSNNTSSSSSIFGTYFHLPLLLGVNMGKMASFVFTPGMLFMLASGSSSSSSSGNDVYKGSGSAVGARLGLGVNIRFSEKFAMQPEFSAMRTFQDNAVWFFNFGIGFNFGSLPTF